MSSDDDPWGRLNAELRQRRGGGGAAGRHFVVTGGKKRSLSPDAAAASASASQKPLRLRVPRNENERIHAINIFVLRGGDEEDVMDIPFPEEISSSSSSEEEEEEHPVQGGKRPQLRPKKAKTSTRRKATRRRGGADLIAATGVDPDSDELPPSHPQLVRSETILVRPQSDDDEEYYDPIDDAIANLSISRKKQNKGASADAAAAADGSFG